MAKKNIAVAEVPNGEDERILVQLEAKGSRDLVALQFQERVRGEWISPTAGVTIPLEAWDDLIGAVEKIRPS